MANLINNIPVPVYKPQQQKKSLPTSIVSNQFPQIQTYEYIPAVSVSPAKTRPTGVRSKKASGHLVKENVFQSAASTVKLYGDIAKNFVDAAFTGEIKKEGSDYYVGKINDLAIRAGSLGIASVLATTKLFPFAKGMEFVGLGTWFASMAIWPQLMGLPIKLKTGVDINQKYIDSYGRRKFVYEDNQYRPMDLYRYVDTNGKPLSPEEYYKKYKKDYVYLEKLGDKLGIPRDIENRNEAVMNKAGQVAVQGKTIWMMTAGVMTPVLSSIVADALQNPVKDGLEKFRYNKQLKKMQEITQEYEKLLDLNKEYNSRNRVTNIDDIAKAFKIEIPENAKKQFEALLGEDGKVLSTGEYKKLKDYLNERFFGTGIKEALDFVIDSKLEFTEPKIKVNNELYEGIKQATKDGLQEAIKKFLPEFREKLPEIVKNYEGISKEDFNNIKNTAELGLETELDVLKTNSLTNAAKRIAQGNAYQFGLEEEAYKLITREMDKKIDEYIKSQKGHIIPRDRVRRLFKFAETHRQLEERIAKFEKASIMNISESITANNWEKVPQSYFEAMNFSKAEITQLATLNPAEASKILAKRMEQIVANPTDYNNVLKKMASFAQKAIEKEEKAVLELTGTPEKTGLLSNLKDLMTYSAEKEFGNDAFDKLSTYYQTRVFEVQKKLRNTIDSFVRPIKALDTFKNIESSIIKILGKNADEYKDKLTQKDYYMFTNMDYETAKSSLRKFIKDVALDKNDINNWTTKFEHDMPGGRRGLKYSKTLLQEIADVVNGELKPDTAEIIGKQFARKCNANNTIIRCRFLALNYKLAEYMKDKQPAKKLIEEICDHFDNLAELKEKLNAAEKAIKEACDGDLDNLAKLKADKNIAEKAIKEACDKNLDNLYIFEELINERKSELSLNQIELLNKFKEKMMKGGKHILDADYKNLLNAALDFKTADKSISELSGKNVTDFFINAAQNYRSRNKWTKLAYGLLAGTIAITAVAIANIGKTNRFNKDKYLKQKPTQGVSR